MNKWLFLMVAILTEVIATSSLKASDGFRKFWPSVLVIACYTLSFLFLSLTLRDIPVGVVYAIWSGVGVVLVALIGWIVLSPAPRSASYNRDRVDRGWRDRDEPVL